MYIGKDEVAKHVTNVYIGDADGVARRVSSIFFGKQDVATTVYKNDYKKCSPSFEGLSFQQIKEIVDSGEAYNRFKPGDYFTVTLKDYYTYHIVFDAEEKTFYQKEVVFQVLDELEPSSNLTSNTTASGLQGKLRLGAKYSLCKCVKYGLDPELTKNEINKYYYSFKDSYACTELNTTFYDLLPDELTSVLSNICGKKVWQITQYDDFVKYKYNEKIANEPGWFCLMTSNYHTESDDYDRKAGWMVLSKDGLEKKSNSMTIIGTFLAPMICI